MATFKQIGVKIRWTGLAALLVVSMGLTACGGDTAPTTVPTTAPTAAAQPAATQPIAATGATGGTSSSDVQEVKVTLTEWGIDPANPSVNAGKVRFVVANGGKFTHNLAVLDGGKELGKTPNFKADEGTKPLELDLKPGTYTIICDIPGHESKGMKGVLTVK